VPRRYVGPSPTSAAPAKSPPKTPELRAWNKLLLLVGAAVAVAALLIVPGIVSKGGKNPVAEAAQATMDSPGVRMDFSFSFQGPEQVTMQGTGVLNGETNRASMHMSMSGGAMSADLDEVLDGFDVYVHSPMLSGIADGKSWLLVRASALGDIPQASGGLGAGLTGPKQQLEVLESASDNVTTVGQEPVNGIATTHYAAIVDLQKLMDEVKDQLPSRLGDLLEKSVEAGSTEQIDVWVDQHGLIRRERSSGSLGSLGSFTSTVDLSDYGIHPQIDVPPESDVYDMTPFIEKALNGDFGLSS
jgi:hypothetical protein